MRFFILATKTVELRGIIEARSYKKAREKAKEHWHIYDTPDNTVSVGTSERGAEIPVISEHTQILKIIHIEDEEGSIEVCQKCETVHTGKCPEKCERCGRVHKGACYTHYRSLQHTGIIKKSPQ